MTAEQPEEALQMAIEDNTKAVEENTGAIAADPLTTATSLANALADNTEAVRTLEERYRHVWVAIVLLVVAVLGSGYAIFENTDARNIACKRDNEMRQANLELWRPILLRPVPPLTSDATPEEVEQYNDNAVVRRSFEETLETGFATHSC